MLQPPNSHWMERIRPSRRMRSAPFRTSSSCPSTSNFMNRILSIDIFLTEVIQSPKMDGFRPLHQDVAVIEETRIYRGKPRQPRAGIQGPISIRVAEPEIVYRHVLPSLQTLCESGICLGRRFECMNKGPGRGELVEK